MRRERDRRKATACLCGRLVVRSGERGIEVLPRGFKGGMWLGWVEKWFVRWCGCGVCTVHGAIGQRRLHHAHGSILGSFPTRLFDLTVTLPSKATPAGMSTSSSSSDLAPRARKRRRLSSESDSDSNSGSESDSDSTSKGKTVPPHHHRSPLLLSFPPSPLTRSSLVAFFSLCRSSLLPCRSPGFIFPSRA